MNFNLVKIKSCFENKREAFWPSIVHPPLSARCWMAMWITTLSYGKKLLRWVGQQL